MSLTLAPGQLAAITRPSGSGKTTLLCVLAGVLAPTRGRVQLGDVDLYALPDAELLHVRASQFGFVFRDFRLIPELGALQNTVLAACFSGMPMREA